MKRPAVHRLTRATAGALLAVGPLVMGLGSAQPAGAGPAESRGPALGAARPAAAADDFVAGSGEAVARVVRLAPRTAGLTYAVTGGSAVAGYQGSLARAEARTLDLGIFGLALTSSSCGRDPPLSPDQLPQPLRATSRDGAQQAEQTALPAGPVGAGREAVSATPDAAATAETVGAYTELPGVLALRGGVSHAGVELVPGRLRSATAEVDLQELTLGAGTVRLLGLRWQATHRTGADTGADGGFEIAGIEIDGTPRPVDTPQQLDAAIAQANARLAPAGLRLSLPEFVRRADERVEVAPLVISLGGSDTATPVLGPALAAAQPLRERAGDLFGDGGCDGPRAQLADAAGATSLVLDILLAGFTGSGSLAVELGGVRVGTEGVAYQSPFKPLPPARSRAPAGAAAAPFAAPRSDTGTRSGSAPSLAPLPTLALPSAPVPEEVPVAAVPAAGADAALAPLATRQDCLPDHPAGRPACSAERGALAALATAGLTAVLLAGDLGRSRRVPRPKPASRR